MSKLLFALRNALGRKLGSPQVCSAPTRAVSIHQKTNAEPQDRYDQGGYHPVSPGEVFRQRYKVIRKLGWGQYSTVWLVRDTHMQSLAALKILVADLSTPESGNWNELGLLKLIQERNPQSRGYGHLCQLLDNFTHQGPNGSHICLVMEAMSMSALDVYEAFPGAMPIPLLKRLSKHVLSGLQYLHEECGVIHTDIKGDNILIAGAPLEEEQSHIQLSIDDLMSATFKLSDFGEANMMSNRFAKLIQPTSLRSPEVIIGAEWDTKTDIWNLGCLIYEFARGTKLFDPFWNNDKSGMNAPQTHLAQIVGLCGAFPSEFLMRGEKSSRYFDDQGSLLRGVGMYTITIEDLLSRASHSPQDVCEAADFLSRMLVIDPTERWSAAQMLDHPWLRHVD